MAKRYVFKVLYGDKLIDKIDVEVTEQLLYQKRVDAADDFATDEANARALDKLRVELEEVIEEE